MAAWTPAITSTWQCGKEEGRDVFPLFRICIISTNTPWPELNHLIMWPDLSARETSAQNVSMCIVKNWILNCKGRQGEWMNTSLCYAKTSYKLGHWFHCQGSQVLQGSSNTHNCSLVTLRIPLTSLDLWFFICKGRLSCLSHKSVTLTSKAVIIKGLSRDRSKQF